MAIQQSLQTLHGPVPAPKPTEVLIPSFPEACVSHELVLATPTGVLIVTER